MEIIKQDQIGELSSVDSQDHRIIESRIKILEQYNLEMDKTIIKHTEYLESHKKVGDRNNYNFVTMQKLLKDKQKDIER